MYYTGIKTLNLRAGDRKVGNGGRNSGKTARPTDHMTYTQAPRVVWETHFSLNLLHSASEKLLLFRAQGLFRKDFYYVSFPCQVYDF